MACRRKLFIAMTLLVTSLSGMPALADSSGEVYLVNCNGLAKVTFYQWPSGATSQPPPGSGFGSSNLYARWDAPHLTPVVAFSGVNIVILKAAPFGGLNLFFNSGPDTLDDTQVNLCFGSSEPPRLFQIPIRLRDFKLTPMGSNWYLASLSRDTVKAAVEGTGGKFPAGSYLANLQFITDSNGQRSFVLGKVTINTSTGPLVPDQLMTDDSDLLECSFRYYCFDETRLHGKLRNRIRMKALKLKDRSRSSLIGRPR